MEMDPFSRLLGVAGEVEAGDSAFPWTTMSSVQVSLRLRRYSSVSRSTTSSLVSFSTALILCTTWGRRIMMEKKRGVERW